MYRGDAAALQAHAVHPAGNEPSTVGTGLFQEIHAQLLSAQPATTTRMEHGHHFLGDKGEMLANQPGAEEKVGSCWLSLEALGRRRRVGRIAGFMYANGPGAQRRDRMGRLCKAFSSRLVGGQEDIAAPV